ncbi:TM2 domain-containing protein [Campylobacter sp. 2018MI35]|uniref:TM2 domain-containing protein n=1 Tax=Campylobacter molothri TaxID=1032242 RepID=UPI0019075619|nr:TM2 domain-containing protein [Campylobacter sp. 2018MI35]MBK2001264.1 TM2 domain-containing protein [Campylobacter sp. 2018MI35]
MDAMSLFLSIENKLPKEYGFFRKRISRGYKYSEPIMSNEDLKKKLEALSSDELDKVCARLQYTKLKNPTLAFWVYNFLLGGFGVARFYIGQIGFGIFRLALTLLSIIIGFVAESSYDSFWISVSKMFDYGNFGIAIIDLFIIGVLLRNQNLEKVNLIIDEVKS